MNEPLKNKSPERDFKFNDVQLLDILAQYLEDALSREREITSGVLLPSIAVLHAQLLPKIKRILEGEDVAKVLHTKAIGAPVSTAASTYYNMLAGYVELRVSKGRTSTQAYTDAAHVLGIETAKGLDLIRKNAKRTNHVIVFHGDSFESFSAGVGRSPDQCLRDAYDAHIAEKARKSEPAPTPE